MVTVRLSVALILPGEKPVERQGSYLPIQLMINNAKKKDVWCHFKALLAQWDDKSTRNSAYFQETVGRLANCWWNNESISVIKSSFHNVTAFVRQNPPFSYSHGKCSDFNCCTCSLCNCPSLLVLFYMAGVSTQQLRNNSFQFPSGLN